MSNKKCSQSWERFLIQLKARAGSGHAVEVAVYRVGARGDAARPFVEIFKELVAQEGPIHFDGGRSAAFIDDLSQIVGARKAAGRAEHQQRVVAPRLLQFGISQKEPDAVFRHAHIFQDLGGIEPVFAADVLGRLPIDGPAPQGSPAGNMAGGQLAIRKGLGLGQFQHHFVAVSRLICQHDPVGAAGDQVIQGAAALQYAHPAVFRLPVRRFVHQGIIQGIGGAMAAVQPVQGRPALGQGVIRPQGQRVFLRHAARAEQQGRQQPKEPFHSLHLFCSLVCLYCKPSAASGQ